MIFSPFAGVLVDRLNRRTVMISSQLLMGLPIFMVGILVVFESIEVWQLILASIFTSAIFLIIDALFDDFLLKLKFNIFLPYLSLFPPDY